VLTVLRRVAERREPFPLEGRDRFGVRFEIDHVARHEPDHPAADEDAGAAEHTAHVDRAELSK